MKLITLGFLLVFIGFLVILAGIFSMAYHAWRTGETGTEEPEAVVRGGGVVMIGPIPIIFGTDVASVKIVVILAIVLMIIALILLFIPWKLC
jgi:uncharacterized protein (TIGR00304 family)